MRQAWLDRTTGFGRGRQRPGGRNPVARRTQESLDLSPWQVPSPLNGDFWILADSREKKVLSETRLDSALSASPIAANGVVSVATMRNLCALQKSL
ncbi:MAG: hypothetical protein Q8Q12_06410 [bacterium]|nr:hypothetical protein [bacterium]